MATYVRNYYNIIANNIEQLIYLSGYSNMFIAQKIGLTPIAFAVKKEGGMLSVREIRKILSLIGNDDVENFIMLEIMRSRKIEPIITFEQLQQDEQWFSRLD